MTEQECLDKMVAPGTRRPGKYRDGVIQVWVTRACDQACFHCTQGSNLAGKPGFITLDQFRQACQSLKGYWGVVGMFGGNPAMHPDFHDLCQVMREEVPAEQRGIWCNNPMTIAKARQMQLTFNPAVSNLNVHLDRKAYDLFKAGWPECHPCGLTCDSRHAPTMVAMKDVVTKKCPTCEGSGIDRRDVGPYPGDDVRFPSGGWIRKECSACSGSGKVSDESRIWELISGCDINKHWSAMIGVFRGELRAWFCEVAGAQAMLHQDESDYPDTGVSMSMSSNIAEKSEYGEWWKWPMNAFRWQVEKHCFDCGVPLRGHGENAMTIFPDAAEQVSATHEAIYRPKRVGRKVEVVTDLVQLGSRLDMVTKYLQNSNR